MDTPWPHPHPPPLQTLDSECTLINTHSHSDRSSMNDRRAQENEWMNECMNEWMTVCMNVWMTVWMNENLYIWHIQASTQILVCSRHQMHTVHTCRLTQAKTTKDIHTKTQRPPTPPRKVQQHMVVRCKNIYTVERKEKKDQYLCKQ